MKRLVFLVRLWIISSLLASLVASVLHSPAAAQATAIVTISELSDIDFPYVTMMVTVTNASGAAIVGLAAADFTLTEDGIVVASPNIALETVQGDPASLVLALDTSMDEASFAKIQSGLKELVNNLGPADQVALVTFSTTPQVALPFTADKPTALRAIDDLTAGGTANALSDAVLMSVNLATTAANQRRAVYVITDGADSSTTASTTIGQATAAGVPITTLGFGDSTNAESLASMSRATGGQSFDLTDAGTAQRTLPGLGAALRKVSYRLTYTSSIRPDNQPHALVISVSRGAVTGSATADFVAVAHEVKVVVPGITDGQLVVGKVYLLAEVTADSPVAQVEYLLNDQPIATVTTPPYSFEWDSTTVNAGTYQLTVRAADATGNTGETTLEVTVSIPFTVQITAETAKVQVGEDFTANAEVKTPAQVSQVDFLVDGKLIASDDSEPYRVAFNTESYEAGKHTMTARAVDTLGRTAESSLDIRFTESLLPIVVRWVFRAALVVGMIATFVIGMLVARAAARSAEKSLLRECRVEVINDGNARARFDLRADDPNTALGFEFSLNGVPLARKKISDVVPSLPPAPSAPSVARPATTAPGIVCFWSQTPHVEPGQSLGVTLTLRPLKSNRTQQYFFRVIAQAADIDDLPPTIEQGNIEIKGLSAAQRLMPVAIILVTLGIVALLIALLVANIALAFDR